MMQIGAGAMLVILSIVTCGGGRPIGYEPIPYGAVDVDPPARESSEHVEGVNVRVNSLPVTGNTAGAHACHGFLCTWRMHNEITTLVPQVSHPIEHGYSGKILTHYVNYFS